MNPREVREPVRVRLPALLDDATTAEAGPELRRLAADVANDRIVLDARDVNAICPAGLGLLAAVGLITRHRGAHVEVVNCDPRLLGLLRVARLDASPGDCSDPSHPCPDGDWTPWWSGAAANA